MIEVALTEKQFKAWTSTEQKQWLKEHPTSKFGKTHNTMPNKKQSNKIEKLESKPKLSLEEKKAKADARFNEILSDKSDSDKKAFITARKHGIAIPPAWNSVTFNKKPINGVYATGRDAKGKLQRVEDKNFRLDKIKEKHGRIQKELEPRFDKIVKKLEKDLSTPEKQCLYLITQTALRIGDKVDKTTKNTAYGASTLLGKHVKVKGNTITLNFIGKKGVEQNHTLENAALAKVMKNKKPDEPVFDTNAEKVRLIWREIGGSEKVHDIRSLIATRLAKGVVKKSEKPTTQKELNALKKEAAETAAKKLGNNPSESLATYIDNSVFPELSFEESAVEKPDVVYTEKDSEEGFVLRLPKDENKAWQYVLKLRRDKND